MERVLELEFGGVNRDRTRDRAPVKQHHPTPPARNSRDVHHAVKRAHNALDAAAALPRPLRPGPGAGAGAAGEGKAVLDVRGRRVDEDGAGPGRVLPVLLLPLLLLLPPLPTLHGEALTHLVQTLQARRARAPA